MFHIQVEKEFSTHLNFLHTEKGGKYMLVDFNAFYLANDIWRQLMVAWTPHQNGVVERKNYTILEVARTLYLSLEFPPFL